MDNEQQADDLFVAHIDFLTGSNFEGAWNSAVHTMDGFGTYRFPDGAEYRGGFVRGKFHGIGQIKLATPYRYTFKGEFAEGKLIKIEDMWFNDGLHVQGTFNDGEFLCDDWKYLTPQDRRYQLEHYYGQQPVGPTSYLTSTLQTRVVPPNCFDAEEGIYNAETGWLTERPPPFSKSIYLSCPDEKSWIKYHCRVAHKEAIKEPLPSICRKIMANNLANEESQLKEIILYAPKKQTHRELYFPKVCKEHPKKGEPTADRLLPADRLRSQLVSDTELCIRKQFCKEEKRVDSFTKLWNLHFPDQLVHIERDRPWTSSSDPITVDSGASHTISRSFSDNSLHKKTKGYYEEAYWMTQKKHTDSVNVVQSNMKRPTSFVDINLSVFQL